jgi:prophage maintenance system killer protein
MSIEIDQVTVIDQFGRAFETELRSGDYKVLANNPTRENGSLHEYCPPEQVASEMDRLVAMYARHVEKQVRPEVQAAWLHHAFTQIHPFQDGNGRVARAIATLVFLKAEYFPLVINRDDRQKYVESLESADSGDLQPLVHLFSVVQKRLLTKAIGLAIDVRPAKDVNEAIEATRDLLLGLGQIMPKDQWLRARAQAGRLAHALRNKLNEMAGQ